MGRPTETQLGRGWKARLEDDGWWVQKLPASNMAGLPDYMTGAPGRGFRFVEAKCTLKNRGKWAFRRDQLTIAQQFFLDRIHQADQNAASVVILDEEGYLEVLWGNIGEGVTRHEFDKVKFPYRKETP